MNERQVANMALELATQLIRLNGYGDLGPNVLDVTQAAADMLRSQEKYINLLHKLLNANGIGVGRNLLTGEVIPFEVEDEQ